MCDVRPLVVPTAGWRGTRLAVAFDAANYVRVVTCLRLESSPGIARLAARRVGDAMVVRPVTLDAYEFVVVSALRAQTVGRWLHAASRR